MTQKLQHPYFFLLLPPLFWGGNAVAGRLAAGDIAPFTLTALRWALSLLVLVPLAWPSLKRDWPTIRQTWPLFFIYGVLGFSGFNMLLYLALNYTTAINSGLIQSTTPMIILLLAFCFFKERFGVLQLAGLFLAALGVALIVTQGDVRQLLDFSPNKGDLIMLGCGLLYALYTLGLKFKPKVSLMSFITLCGLGGFVFSLPFVAYEVMTQAQVINYSWKALGVIVYTSIFASLLAQFAYAKGVELIGAGRAGFAINLVPIFGSLLAVLILGEQFRWYHLLALLLVLTGIALSEYSVRRRHQH